MIVSKLALQIKSIKIHQPWEAEALKAEANTCSLLVYIPQRIPSGKVDIFHVCHWKCYRPEATIIYRHFKKNDCVDTKCAMVCYSLLAIVCAWPQEWLTVCLIITIVGKHKICKHVSTHFYNL